MQNQRQQSHLETLQAKHAALSEYIDQELQRPGACPSRLRQLKAEKLRLKDRIECLADE